MTEESKKLSDLHLLSTSRRGPIYLDFDTTQTILNLYLIAVDSRGIEPDTVVGCNTAFDVFKFLHSIFCDQHQGDTNG
jgi:hypothetical protein